MHHEIPGTRTPAPTLAQRVFSSSEIVFELNHASSTVEDDASLPLIEGVRCVLDPTAEVSFPRVHRDVSADHGLWRSLVAHYTGGVGVAGSNPVSPTEKDSAERERN